MTKIDYKKQDKSLYLPKERPDIVRVPRMTFIAIEGQGDPNGDEFASATAALYSLSYAAKMSYKSEAPPEGYYEYTVYPLEGVWDLIDVSVPPTVKSNLKYKLMIRQPAFLDDALFERLRRETSRKKPNPFLAGASFVSMEEGLCCQMMHVGSYDDEPASFATMEAYCRERGYRRTSLLHREIYISDPRKTEPSRRKTVLRIQVAPEA
ncbi:hypothetical protein FE782_14720 [Paenibacillus antri]|uniref:GyrI-like small molecule binding domain-containing protein n=1 Tax=Paenibacillus antri TaxID=2582848 RepID=A0A5R9G4S4_9BACL|nr:GyrI-like domain-containing protein [Paenibacillus antri]TLS51367.1 hypothetical protein FE782_14720 [Paenibacillus antri]